MRENSLLPICLYMWLRQGGILNDHRLRSMTETINALLSFALYRYLMAFLRLRPHICICVSYTCLYLVVQNIITALFQATRQ